MSDWLADDVTEIGPSFRRELCGKADFFEKYRSYLENSTEIVSYRLVAPAVISLSARFSLIYFSYRMKARRNGRVKNSQGKESMLLEKFRGRWLVKFIHWHQDPDRWT
jgi:hypothetical protein